MIAAYLVSCDPITNTLTTDKAFSIIVEEGRTL